MSQICMLRTIYTEMSLMVLRQTHFGIYESILSCNNEWGQVWHLASTSQGSKQSHTMKNQ